MHGCGRSERHVDVLPRGADASDAGASSNEGARAGSGAGGRATAGSGAGGNATASSGAGAGGTSTGGTGTGGAGTGGTTTMVTPPVGCPTIAPSGQDTSPCPSDLPLDGCPYAL